jgi:hypothetical protein
MAEQSPPIDEDEYKQFSPLELAELDKIKDPELRKLKAMEIHMQKQAFIEQMQSELGETGDLRDAARKKFRA